MVSPPTANPKTRSRSASSKASTTKSASSRDEPTDCATTNISASKCSPACCRRYDPPKSPTRFPEDPQIFHQTQPDDFIIAIGSVEVNRPYISTAKRSVTPEIVSHTARFFEFGSLKFSYKY